MHRKSLLLILGGLLLVVSGVWYYFHHSDQSSDTPLVTKLSKQERIDQAFNLEYVKTVDPSTKTIPTQRLMRARQRSVQQLAFLPFAMADAIPNIAWEERGSNNVGGRTRAIMVDLNDNSNNTVWAGGVAGGLWKTTNFQSSSTTWKQINDFFDNLAVTCIVQDPNNPSTMYFGTGEGVYNADAARGLGVWKSTDGGLTWNQLLATKNSAFYYVQDLIIDTNGHIYAGTHVGLYKSTNGGASWTRVFGANRFIADLEMGADGDVYVATGRIVSAGSVWKSDYATHRNSTGNSGTWTDISPAGDYWRMEIATAPSDADRLYVLCQGKGQYDVTKIYRSDNVSGNSGVTWTSLPVPTIIDQGQNSVFTRYQAWYDLIGQVDPNDADVYYIGAVDALRSTNKGASWTQLTTWSLYGASGYSQAQNVHSDHHNLIFMPGSSSKAILTTDGGIFYSEDANNTSSYPSWKSKNLGYNITQFYACATSNEAGANRFLAGAQDNGSHRFLNPGMNNTTQVSGGDGAFCHIDQDNPNIQITSYVYNNYFITNNAWGSVKVVAMGGDAGGRFINPTDYDSDTNILYCAANDNEYRFIKNVGTDNTAGATPLAALGGKISAVLVSPNTDNRVFFGTDGNKIVRVDNANTSSPSATVIGSAGTTNIATTSLGDLPNVMSTPLPGGRAYISSIAVETGDDDHILVTYSNYGTNSVYETKDGGTTWTNVEGDLPDMPVRWGIFNPTDNSQALLGTELGVWTTNALNGTNTKWGPSNTMLANTRVDMLQVRPADNLLLAATHGRGLFTSTSLNSSTLPVELISFSATANKNNVILEWASSSEVNFSHYEIERSDDGANWEYIAELTAKGNTTSGFDYVYVDTGLDQNIVFYRLKMVDLDGSFTYSNVRQVSIEQPSSISIYPNPVSQILKVNKALGKSTVVKVFGLSGRLFIDQPLVGRQIDLSSLPSGEYVVRIHGDNDKLLLVEKIIKI